MCDTAVRIAACNYLQAKIMDALPNEMHCVEIKSIIWDALCDAVFIGMKFEKDSERRKRILENYLEKIAEKYETK